MLVKDFEKYMDLYFTHGTRSNKATNFIHSKLGKWILSVLDNKDFSVKYEVNVKCNNYSGKKKCDIVLYKNSEIHTIFPVKFVKTNYVQNRNNYLENLIGETFLLNSSGHSIIPINIILSQTPYLEKNKKIKIFQKNNIANSFEIYSAIEFLTGNINMIVQTEHLCDIGENFSKIKITGVEHYYYKKKEIVNNVADLLLS